MEIELGLFERQAMIERLVHRFAALNHYKIEPHVQILEAEHPRIQIWIAMAEAAIEEMENRYKEFKE
jgi:hypothetical protein